MRESIPALTYYITLSSQGGWIKCPSCGAADGWSPEFLPDTDTIVRYLCLGCGVRWIEAAQIAEREIAHPAGIQAYFGECGNAIQEGYQSLRALASHAGLTGIVSSLDEWIGEQP